MTRERMSRSSGMMVPNEILKKPYARMVIPDVDGTFSAEIAEFPGCIAVGETAAEALESLEEVAVDWIAVALEQGQNIPEPMDTAGFSGKLVLRMPKSLHQRASFYAERDGVSLNQFIVTSLAERVGTRAHPVVWSTSATETLAYLNLSHISGVQDTSLGFDRLLGGSPISGQMITANTG